MKEGQQVLVRLHGDESWYRGVVLDDVANMWVQLFDHPVKDFIADHNSIVEWTRP